jgi:MoxR-like ATPase
MTDWGLPWLTGGQEHDQCARRNKTGRASVSTLLVKALLSALSGKVLSIQVGTVSFEGSKHPGYRLKVDSHSSPGTNRTCWMMANRSAAGIPYGGPDKATYHVGVLAIADALAHPEKAWDFWASYLALLSEYKCYGPRQTIQDPLLEAADELYYLLRYRFEGDCDVDYLSSMQVAGSTDLDKFSVSGRQLVDVLTDPDALEEHVFDDDAASDPVPADESPDVAHQGGFGDFVGWQGPALHQAVSYGENCLLAGPTGTGKTMLTELVAQEGGYDLVTIEGKEGLVDLDFLGAILPQEDDSRKWVDGPLLRAMRMAQAGPVLLFIDEINRVPREHINLLLGLLNPKSAATLRQMGLDILGDDLFYTVEVPMTSELVFCPTAHLRVVAAGNFGRAYAVYDLDPAVRRRFDTVIEFDYLDFDLELDLVLERTGLSHTVAKTCVKLAGETRRMLDSGELPGAIDTASLINWAGKCQRTGAETVAGIMQQARLSWADLVCGRDHTGRVNQANVDALGDYLESLGLLPVGARP